MYNGGVTPNAEKRQREAVLEAFSGSVPPQGTSLVYRLGLLVVAMAMVLLPLGYVGLVGLVALGVYLNGTESLILLMVGSILVLFMIKPLFAPATAQAAPRKLSPGEQPLLFAFVERLARAVGAPAPREIHVTCDVNAAASLRRGLWSAARGNDLVLTLGLPLVASLDLRQLTGVLAHELGHFAQHTGMGLIHVINRVNVWFARVVYERDAWDERLIRWSEGVGVYIGIPLYLARLCIWLTRKVLWVPMALGNVISSFLLRQMEYDADRYQIHLTGSASFESTARRVEHLTTSMALANADLYEFWNERLLPDNLPGLVAANEEQIPSTFQEILDEQVAQQDVGLLQSHPSMGARIARAQAEPNSGSFSHDGPAADLFADLTALCSEVSLAHYNEVLDEEVTAADLHPFQDLLRRQKTRSEEFETLRRYFQDMVSVLRPLWLLDPPESPVAEEDARAQLVQARDALSAAAEEYNTLLREYDVLGSRVEELGQVAALLAAGFKLDVEDLELPAPTPGTAGRSSDQVRQQMAALGQQMEPHERRAAQRLQLVLRLLDEPWLADRLDDAPAKRAEVARLIPAVHLLSTVMPLMDPMGAAVEGLVALLHNMEGNEQNQALEDELIHQRGLARRHLQEVESQMDATLYPFAHGSGTITVHRHLVPGLPAEEDLAGHVEVCGHALDRAQTLYVALLGRLAALAEEVERTLDLPPLPDTPLWDDESPEEQER